MNRRLFFLATLALGGCATMPPAPPWPPVPLAELEPLYSAVAGRDAMIIRVASNGCTEKPDFAFYVEHRGATTALAFARKHVDTCKSFAQGQAVIAFTWSELGLDPKAGVFLLNPVAAWMGPGS